MSADAPPARKAKSRLVQVVTDSQAPDSRGKLSPAKGMLIGAGICAAFWAAVAAAVVAAR